MAHVNETVNDIAYKLE